MPLEIPTYRQLEARWKALRQSRGIRVREVACVGAPRTLLCAEAGEAGLPVISISAGVHGDERSGPDALLRLVENDLLDGRFAYRMWPCTNPTGFERNTRTSIDDVDINRTFGRGGGSPEAKAVVMANRDLKFALALDLHEDCDAERFYFYAYGDLSVAQHLRETLQVEALQPDPIAERDKLGGLSLSLLLQRNAARRVCTFEAPGLRPYSERVELHVNAVRAAIAALTENERPAADSQAIHK